MLIEIVGWFGSLLVVLAYALNMNRRMSSDSLTYYLFNIVGSACLIVNTMAHKALPSAIVNIIWVMIALFSLARRKIMKQQVQK